MTNIVKYNSSNEGAQGLLRLALFAAWNGKCHWCNASVENASYFEIDHILPRTKYNDLRKQFTIDAETKYTPEYLAELRKLPLDKDDVGNLAPICSAGPRCNQKKSGFFEDDMIGAVSASLKKAAGLSTKITNHVHEMLTSQGDEEHLVALLALSKTDATQKLANTYGALVLERLWQLDKRTFETFRVPAEIRLNVDEGETPDYFADATRTGTGVDGFLRLNHAEQIALGSAELLFGVNPTDKLSEEISEAIVELDSDIIGKLGDVHQPNIQGPRWLLITDHQFHPGERPKFSVELTMQATFGGTLIVGTDENGLPRFRETSVRAKAQLMCCVYLNDGETDHQIGYCETEVE